MSQNHKNGQTTQTSYVKTARLLWVNPLSLSNSIQLKVVSCYRITQLQIVPSIDRMVVQFTLSSNQFSQRIPWVVWEKLGISTMLSFTCRIKHIMIIFSNYQAHNSIGRFFGFRGAINKNKSTLDNSPPPNYDKESKDECHHVNNNPRYKWYVK